MNQNGDHGPQQERLDDAPGLGKRKRSPVTNGTGNGISAGKREPISSYVHQARAHAAPHHGLGISLSGQSRPPRAPFADPAIPSSHIASLPDFNARGDSIKFQEQKVTNGKSKATKSKTVKSNRTGEESDSDLDTDAVDLLQRMAATESDEEETRPSAASAPSLPKPRQLRPNPGAPHGWRPPMHPQMVRCYRMEMKDTSFAS